MLSTVDALAKTLAKYQKVTFWSQKNSFRCFFFFLLTAGDALTKSKAKKNVRNGKGDLVAIELSF